tara:strand:+ start:190 stop:603 length:414 start_codon:yes stop_codon:yes gene_type:complete
MNKIFFLLLFLFFSISQSSISQKKHFPNHSNNHIHKHNNFAGGFFAGLVFSEFFGLKSRVYRQMYFKYKPIQQNWKLTRDFNKRGTGFYSKGKVVAKFENPNGGRDFIVTLTRNGEWYLDCPKKLRKILKNKVKRNL